MINIHMQKDVDYDKMTREAREDIVGPQRLVSLHKALQNIGVSDCHQRCHRECFNVHSSSLIIS